MAAIKKPIRLQEFPDLFSKLTRGGRCTNSQLRDSVLASLHDLFNTRPGVDALPDGLPHVTTSVLCYGVREPNDRAGDAADYALHLGWAIRSFEPRLLASSLIVQAISSSHVATARWLFRIEASFMHRPA